MKNYRLYPMKPGGGIKSGDDFCAADDASVVIEARRMAHTIEVWHGTQRVARVDHPR